ncbi:MAG: hypothetical protein KatS3mg014_2156 [Actinomycetota bacterium]|nr:MAG: hypothetical protein KatS3mg014_2156 [Actinomycetota bacterium]
MRSRGRPGDRGRVGVGVDDERTQPHDPVPGPAEAATQHGEAHPDLGLGRAGVQEPVGQGIPGEALQVAALDDHDDGDVRVAIAEGAQDGVGLPRVLGRVEEEELGPEGEHVLDRRDRELLDLEVEEEAGEGGEHLLRPPVREQDVEAHGPRLPPRHARR